MLQLSEGTRRQPVATALVAGKASPIDDNDVPACPRQRDGGRGTRGAAADHGDVGLQHGPNLLVRAAAAVLAKPVRRWPVCLS